MSIAARRFFRPQKGAITPPEPTGLSLAASGIWGAGFQNAGDKADGNIHTGLRGGLATGADVAGVHISANYGDDWAMCNRRLVSANDTRIVSIRWSETTPNRLYMYASPTTGYSSKLYRGTYNATTKSIDWGSAIAALPAGAYAGNETPPGEGTGIDGDGNGPNHPRQTGRKMMILDEVNGYIYVGTIKGIYRYNLTTGTGALWQLNGKWITSLCFEPSSRMTLYATADGSGTDSGIDGPDTTGGVWKINNIRTDTPTVYQAPSSVVGTYPQACSAVEVAGGVTKLFVACGNPNVVRWEGTDFDVASNWTDVTNNLNNDSSTMNAIRWSGIEAVVDSGNITVLATDSCNAQGRTGKTVAWSFNGGANWTKNITINSNINGVTTEGEWWFARSEYNNASMLIGGGVFDSVNPIIDPNDFSRWYIMGRSGIWRTKNKGASWHPIVKATGVSMGHAISCLPHNPNKAMAGDTDWSSFFSSDGFASQPDVCKKLGRVGWSIKPKHYPNGTTPDSTVIIGLGSRDGTPGTKGTAIVNRDPWDATSLGSGWWSQVNSTRPLPTGPSNVDATPRCTGASIAQVGTSEIILAAFQGLGVFRKIGIYTNDTNPGGVWSQVANGLSNGGTKDGRVSFAWSMSNQNVVWMCDPQSDTIARSTNGGQDWTNYTPVGLSNIAFTSQIEADPAHAGVYYLLDYDGSIWRITNGDSATPTVAKYVVGNASFNPVCLTIHPTSGKIAVCSGAVGGSNTPTFWVADYNSTTFTKKTVPRWEDVGRDPQHIAWGSNDKLYVALYAGYVVIQGLNTAQ